MILVKSLRDRYTQLLLTLTVAFFMIPFMEKLQHAYSAISLIFLAAIVLSFRTCNYSQLKFYTYVVLAFFTFLLKLLSDIPSIFSHILLLVHFSLFAFFLIISIFNIARSILATPKITSDTVQGGICIYLLLGYLWTIFYFITLIVDPYSFHVQQGQQLKLFYFSFTTLTTLGYGDIYPISGLAMSLANIEVIIGQIHLAVFVARLVGLHIIHSLDINSDL